MVKFTAIESDSWSSVEVEHEVHLPLSLSSDLTYGAVEETTASSVKDSGTSVCLSDKFR